MMTRTLLVGLSAAAIAASLAAQAPAAAQSREVLNGSSGPTLVVGSSRARLCYERAVEGAASNPALAICNAALAGPLTSRNRIATLVNRSIVHAEREEFDEALADLAAAEERRPDLATIHINYGDVYSRLGRWADAEDAFTRSLDLGIAQAQRAYFGRGIAREEQGDIEGAYADYSAAAELAPGWSLPRRELERFEVVRNGAAGGA